jgi:hypothetical protein
MPHRRHGRIHARNGNLHLAWDYAQNPQDHWRFRQMLRVSPLVFGTILSLIKDHPVFQNNSNNSQVPVEVQLAVTLYRMGRYGNGGSVVDIARVAGCSEGSVEKYTERCFDAIEPLHNIFVRKLTPEEKEIEKKWIEEQLGFTGGTWREGWLMYDGTIVVIYKKPGLNGDAYFTRKSTYGLNVQVNLHSHSIRVESIIGTSQRSDSKDIDLFGRDLRVVDSGAGVTLRHSRRFKIMLT